MFCVEIYFNLFDLEFYRDSTSFRFRVEGKEYCILC